MGQQFYGAAANLLQQNFELGSKHHVYGLPILYFSSLLLKNILGQI